MLSSLSRYPVTEMWRSRRWLDFPLWRFPPYSLVLYTSVPYAARGSKTQNSNRYFFAHALKPLLWWTFRSDLDICYRCLPSIRYLRLNQSHLDASSPLVFRRPSVIPTVLNSIPSQRLTAVALPWGRRSLDRSNVMRKTFALVFVGHFTAVDDGLSPLPQGH